MDSLSVNSFHVVLCRVVGKVFYLYSVVFVTQSLISSLALASFRGKKLFDFFHILLAA